MGRVSTYTTYRQVADDPHCQEILESNLLSWNGRILVTLRTDGGRVHVEAATKIPGQMYDWGRSERMLGKLFGAADERAATFRERDL